MTQPRLSMTWIVLTQGNRPVELAAALASIRAQDFEAEIRVVVNGAAGVDAGNAPVTVAPINLGVPGGRHLGVSETKSDLIAFLDDDATLPPGASAVIAAEFAADPHLAAVSLRVVDDEGETTRRHVPRRGREGADRGGPVSTFLGGACVLRRSAYERVGGYFTDLFYGHEELELSWRLVDAGWAIRYLAGIEVFHPKTEISRHAEGWRLTGRNRVWIARRSLPWPVAAIHVVAWLAIGAVRSPPGCRRSYVSGWFSGWRDSVERSPISWSTVIELGRLGRLPLY